MREVEKAIVAANATVTREEWTEAERALLEVQDRVGRLLREVALKQGQFDCRAAEPDQGRLKTQHPRVYVDWTRVYMGWIVLGVFHGALGKVLISRRDSQQCPLGFGVGRLHSSSKRIGGNSLPARCSV
jgi:hypothetical protein